MAHLHEVRDSDTHFVIDPVTRWITNSSDKNTLMQGDHNSEVYTFEIPKEVEGHDMSQCNRVEIHYIDASADKTSKSTDVYTVADMQPDENEPETLTFSWLVSGNATKYAGLLSFRIRFGCVDENGNYTYKWHTDIYKGITISDGFDNAPAVVEEYSDVLAAWESRLDALEDGAGVHPVTYVDSTTAAPPLVLLDLAPGAYVLNGNFSDNGNADGNQYAFDNTIVQIEQTGANQISVIYLLSDGWNCIEINESGSAVRRMNWEDMGSNIPITYINSTDPDNCPTLRSLESGICICNGYFAYYDGSKTINFTSNTLLHIFRNDTKSTIYMHKSKFVYIIEITDTDYTQTGTNLINIESRMAAIENSILEANDAVEQLTICHALSYPSAEDFSYTERTSAANATYCYVVAKQSTISGGLLAVDFDANTATNFDMNLYLFDANGNAYQHTYSTARFDGELSNPAYCKPGAMAGFGKVISPFTVQIPDGCTVMASMRSATNGTVSADGSIVTTQDFANWAVGGGITFTVTKKGTSAKFVSAEQGVENANRYMVTDENGDVVPGAPIGEENEEIIRASINPNILSLGHRGCGIAPENTLAAFRLAKKMGFDAVETDIAYTSDSVAVLLHNTDIDDTSNGTGKISELTFEQVRALDFGSWKSAEYAGEKIPTFDEFMALCKNIGLTPYIELKSSASPQYTEEQINGLVDVVKRYGMLDKVAWVSGSVSYLTKIKNADATARLGLIFSDIDTAKIGYANSLKTDSNEVFISASQLSCTDEMVQLCIDAGIPLMFWGIDTVEEVLAAHTYAFGFCTDTIVAGVELYKAALDAVEE